jgi:soluble lytic murein transglycosylase-like protein
MRLVMFVILQSSVALACSLTAQLRNSLETAALSYGLEPALLEAVVWQESRYCVDALSPKGAIGLGQLMPGTAVSLGVNPHDTEENLFGAAAYLREQWDRFENWELALAAYNAGPGAVVQAQGIPVNGETESYVPAVLEKYSELATRDDATRDDSVSLEITPVVYVKPVSLAALIPKQGGLNVYTRRK